jgi:hypothetical protein
MTPEEKREAAMSGQAWADFCESLKDAGQLILDNSTDELDRVEGFRYLSRLTRGGLDSFIEASDTSFPSVNPIPHMLKIGCDNPDAFYQRVEINPRHQYRITGTRGTVNYLSIGAYSGGYGVGAAKAGNQGLITDNDPHPNGVIDVIASVEDPDLAPGQRWLEMSTKSTILIFRQFYLDRTSERPADLKIQCLDPSTPLPEPFSSAALVDGLAMSALFVHGVAQRFLTWVNDYFLERPNTLDYLPDQDQAGGWGDPNQLFRHGYWTLEPGQALVVTVPAVEAYYWNFQLNNLWEESLDYRHLQVTTNKHTASYEADGTCRIIVADADPGVGNWMDTAHHRHGTMGLRYNQIVTDIPPTCEVVDLADLT